MTCWPTFRQARPSSPSRACTRASSSTNLERVGVDAVLVGESLMRAEDIESACRDLSGGDREHGSF